MKAAVRTRYGPPEVVLIAEVEKPAPGHHEVLVKVHATTVNRTDCACRAARPFFMRFFTGLIRPRKTILGNEFAEWSRRSAALRARAFMVLPGR
jgi:NADPH:quinone reductase-like Zn-dependent oxidoreductase